MHDYAPDVEEKEEVAEEEEDDLPRIQVKVQPPTEERPDDAPPQQDEAMEEGACSPQGEETAVEPGYSEESEKPELPYADTARKKYGNFIMPQNLKLRQWCFNMSTFIPEEDRGGNDPHSPDECV